MIRTSQHILKWNSTCKESKLDEAYVEYKRVVQSFIDLLWEDKKLIKGSFLPKEITSRVDTWLSARLIQCAGKQALQNVKSVYSFTSTNQANYRVDKQSRKGEIYECINCGKVIDADFNGSLNIFARSRNMESIVPYEQKTRMVGFL